MHDKYFKRHHILNLMGPPHMLRHFRMVLQNHHRFGSRGQECREI
jgi:hypothetical protein